ncbi:hypothetical protein TrRE_jg10862 [Triparma retinervis]|uniref:Sec1-like protein n=1 Tax=Triparma retinervis TaxID=2557542 RepID=A0A9W7L0M0_9STRA|nr:hypothetical protein TrRE_jg10862 [Triparma retinervis]
MSLADAQKEALTPLFSNLPTPWSILIYDVPSRSIMSPLLTVQTLRSLGVTLHLLITSSRQPVTGVSGVYLLSPTPSNVDLLIEDVNKGLYPEGVHINWTTKLSRELLERLGRGLVQGGNQANIKGMWDRHTNFLTMNPDVFTLSIPRSFSRSNGGDIKDIEAFVSETAFGLMSVAGCLREASGDIVVRCSTGGCAEMVGRALCSLIKGNAAGGGKGVGGRPVLILLDRTKHVKAMCGHSSSYQALMADVLEYRGGKATDGEGGKWEVGEDEEWWGANKFRSFPEAVEGNGKELKEVEKEEAKLRGINPSTTTGLLGAVSDLPALLARKKSLETHTGILTACMKRIGERDIPQFFDVESRLGRGVGEKLEEEVLALIREKGTAGDKKRLAAIYGLSDGVTVGSLQRVWDALPQEAKGGKLLDTLTQIRSVSNLGAAMTAGTPPTSGNNVLLNLATGVGSSLVAGAREKLAGLVGSGDLASTTRIVNNIMNAREGTEDDEYLYLDPRVHPPAINIPRGQRPRPQTAVVFGVGGGGWGEYGNIIGNKGDWKLIYGATEIMGGEELLAQMAG